MDATEQHASSHAHGELRRDVTIWGSYMWGYADVGADIYVALGLVMAYARGATLYAFAFAGLVYILIGLAYTELASAYPVAGGGQYFVLRGLGDLFGLVAGSGLALDYTIDIALFAMSSAGYLNYFLPNWLVNATFHLGSISYKWFWCGETLVLIGFLVLMNIRGMRESSLLNEFIGAIDITLECFIIIMGLLTAWKPELIASQMHFPGLGEFLHGKSGNFPNIHDFMYGSSLAIISYVGLESISQAAQETRRPSTIVPRTSLTLIFTVFIFAMSFSTVGLGMLPWQTIAAHQDNPVAVLAAAIPLIGSIAGVMAAVMGFLILLISSNSGVMSVSRLTYSLSQFKLVTQWLNVTHPKFKTPIRSILLFSGMAVLQTLLAFLGEHALDILGNLYAFGATLGYFLVFISLIKLRFSDPHTPRPYKVPLNIKIKWRGEERSFPVLGFFGMLGVGLVLYEVILTHKIGRIAGPVWVVLWLLYYIWYRKGQKLPVLGSMERDWETEQKVVLESAEEYDLLEQYKWSLIERDKRKKQT